MLIDKSSVTAYYNENCILCCSNCATEGWTEDDWSNLKSDQVLTEDDRKDEEHLFCDVCKSLI